MTQTVVNFLVNVGTDAAPIYQIRPRVFDLQISTEAQAFYIYEINLLNTALDDFKNATSDSARVTAGTTIQKIFQNLNDWTQFSTVQLNPDGSIFIDPATGEPVQINTPAFPLPNPDPDAPVVGTLDSTMDRYMAENVDNLVRTFRSAGWDPTFFTSIESGGVLNANVLGALQKLTDDTTAGIYQVGSIISRALSAASQARIIGNALSNFDSSLQQILMVDYVSIGNQILFREMNDLKSAIDTNQQTLAYLNKLQDLMNQKDPQQFIQQLQLLNSTNPSNGAVTLPTSVNYSNFESQTYDQVLNTISKFKEDGVLSQYFADLVASGTSNSLAQQAFEAIDVTVGAMVNYSRERIIDNLTWIRQQINLVAGSAGGGLSSSIEQIINDFTNVADVRTWVLDTTTGVSGNYQQNLSNAIVSSQSFNDTERQNLSSVMFIYEEFYKSANSLLNSITKIIEKMAGAISR